jgi:hypothetical protein
MVQNVKKKAFRLFGFRFRASALLILACLCHVFSPFSEGYLSYPSSHQINLGKKGEGGFFMGIPAHGERG